MFSQAGLSITKKKAFFSYQDCDEGQLRIDCVSGDQVPDVFSQGVDLSVRIKNQRVLGIQRRADHSRGKAKGFTNKGYKKEKN